MRRICNLSGLKWRNGWIKIKKLKKIAVKVYTNKRFWAFLQPLVLVNHKRFICTGCGKLITPATNGKYEFICDCIGTIGVGHKNLLFYLECGLCNSISWNAFRKTELKI